MPLQKVTVKGKTGWRYGKSGKVYFGKTGKARALKQMQAILASDFNQTTKE